MAGDPLRHLQSFSVLQKMCDPCGPKGMWGVVLGQPDAGVI